MKQFKDINLKVIARGLSHVIAGKLVSDSKAWIVLESPAKTAGEKPIRTRVIKANIVAFIPDAEPAQEKTTECFVYGCRSPDAKCQGVKCIKVGKKPLNSDVKTMMAECPLVKDSCRAAVLGTLDQMNQKTLSEMLDGTVFGDYPEDK